MSVKGNTLKQRKWLGEYLQSGSATQAALKAYDTNSYSAAGVIASENLSKLKSGRITLSDKQLDDEGILTPSQLLKLSSKLARSAKRDSDKTANIQLLMRYNKMLVDRQEIEDTTPDRSINDLDLEYRELIAKRKAQSPTRPLISDRNDDNIDEADDTNSDDNEA